MGLVAAVALGSACASYQAARHYHEGTEALDRGDTEAAIANLEQAAALQPDASEVQNHLGLALLEAGELEQAHRAFLRAVELDCDNRAAQTNLAVLERQLEWAGSQPRPMETP